MTTSSVEQSGLKEDLRTNTHTKSPILFSVFEVISNDQDFDFHARLTEDDERRRDEGPEMLDGGLMGGCGCCSALKCFEVPMGVSGARVGF